MISRHGNSQTSRYGWRSAQSPIWVRFLVRNIPSFIYLIVAISGMYLFYWRFQPSEARSSLAMTLVGETRGLSAPLTKRINDRLVVHRLKQTKAPLRIGIIAGHKNSDSGAVCDDGLTEAEVNLNISEQVVANLRAENIHVDILDEFDERMRYFFGTAIISIHADSCQDINDLATGFKIAPSSRTDSIDLMNCVEDSYREQTRLPYHANTITEHMTDYHAFRMITPGVEAIILEVGFLFLDRELLTTQSAIPAKAISDGILCYIER